MVRVSNHTSLSRSPSRFFPSEIENLLFILFLVVYYIFISFNLGKYSPHQDEARTCLAGMVFYDFVKSAIRDPSVLLRLSDWALTYNKRYEGFGWAISNYGPVLYVLESFAYAIFGVSLLVARSVTVLLSVLNLAILYLIGRKLGSAKIGLLTTMLLATSPNYFVASKQAYPDMILCFSSSLVIYCFMTSIESPTHRNLIALGLTIGLALMSKSFSVLFLPAIILVFNLWSYGRTALTSRRFWIPMLSCSVVYGIWMIPSVLIGQSSRIHAGELGRKFLTKSIVQVLGNAFHGIWFKGIPVIAPLALLSLVYVMSRLRSDGPKLRLLLVWFFTSLAATIVFDLLGNTDWNRYPVFTYLPTVTLITAYSLCDLLDIAKKMINRREAKTAIRSLTPILLLAILLLGAQQGIDLEKKGLTRYAPYDEIADLILSDSRTRISVLTDLYPVNFYILIKDPNRRVIHKTLFKFGIENLTQYVQSIGFPDYIVVPGSYRLLEQSKKSLSEYYRLVGVFQIDFYKSSEKIMVFRKRTSCT